MIDRSSNWRQRPDMTIAVDMDSKTNKQNKVSKIRHILYVESIRLTISKLIVASVTGKTIRIDPYITEVIIQLEEY